MCLYIKEKSRVQVAKKDIAVYKHLKLINGHYLTTYMDTIVLIGNTYESKLERFHYTVNIGLHSFAYKRNCISDGNCERAAVIVKCIIPKDSQYYVGEFLGGKSYASNKLQYVEIVKILN